MRCIVDLRKPEELDEEPNPFAAPGTHGIAYYHAPFIPPDAGPAPPAPTLADDYKQMLDRFQRPVAQIMKIIAGVSDGAVLFHCHAGKDRTGLVAALLLDLARVPRPIIGQDYALSDEYLRASRAAWLENGPGKREDRERELARSTPRAEVMLETLQHLDRTYGGAAGYLHEAGVTTDEITRLQQRLVI